MRFLVLFSAIVLGSFPEVLDLQKPGINRRFSNLVFSKHEFLKGAEDNVMSRQRSVELIESKCNLGLILDKNGTHACYAMASGKKMVGVAESIEPKEDGLFEALFMYKASRLEAQKLKDSGIDSVVIVTDKDPQCTPKFHELRSLAPTMIGPGSTTITQSHARDAINAWVTGGKFSISSSKLIPAGKFTLTITEDYERSVSDTVKKAISRTYLSPEGTSCTASMLSASVLCQEAEAHIYLGKDGILVKEDRFKMADMLIPITASHKDYFTNIFGCIDYSRD